VEKAQFPGCLMNDGGGRREEGGWKMFDI